MTSAISIDILCVKDVSSDSTGLDTRVARVWSTPISRNSGLNEEMTRPHRYASRQGYGEQERKKMGPKLAQAAISFKFHAIYFFVGLQT